MAKVYITLKEDVLWRKGDIFILTDEKDSFQRPLYKLDKCGRNEIFLHETILANFTDKFKKIEQPPIVTYDLKKIEIKGFADSDETKFIYGKICELIKKEYLE